MELITLGLANIPAPARPKPAEPARPDGAEVGATGTPILSGFLSDIGEYNTDFSGGPFSSFKTFEKMRRSDAQVAATLAAIKLPIRSAKWEVRPPEDATPAEQEAAEFARKCLLEDLDFDAAVRNALLMLDFGCAAHEDVWEIDGGKVRLAKMAPRLPHTFYRWVVKEGTDDLAALEQMGYRGDAYVTRQIPVDKLAIFTFEQEGSNYAGRALLRAMHQSWYIKSNLYRIDAIAQERNGLGIPVVTAADNAKKEDRELAWKWVQQVATHQKAGLVLPNAGWKFELAGITGQVRDAKESISHHNLQISMAGLAMFLTLGQTQTGARSLGETMSDFFSLSIQATANQIARTIERTTLRRLIDYNFTGVRHPKLVPQEILSMKFESLVAALKDLAAAGVNVVQPDDEIEGWIRKKMGAPDAGKPRVRPMAPVQGNPTGRPGEAASAIAGARLAAAQIDRGGVMVDGVQVRREPKPVERCLALSAIAGTLDKGRDEIAAACRAARSRIQAEAVNKLVNTPVRDMHRVSMAPDEKLVAQVEGILQGIYDFGVQQVAEERARQLGGAAPADAAKIRAAGIVRKAAKRTPLGVYADAVVSEFMNTLISRAANVALDWMRRPGDATKGEIIRNVESDLDAQSDKWIDPVASKGANEAFADGRADGYAEHADEIGSVIYSALLDINTCEACAAADGEEGATPDDITAVPNPDCDGGDRCRCVHVFVFSDEGKVQS
jgi:phage gp29-like protein